MEFLPRPYTFEVTKIELVLESEANFKRLTSPVKLANSISATKLLKNVEKSYEKGKFLLDIDMPFFYTPSFSFFKYWNDKKEKRRL